MEVTIACLCPPKDGAPRHEQDTVTLPDVLDFRTTLTIRQTIRVEHQLAAVASEVPTLAETIAMMAEAYLLHTIASWSLVDEAGKPMPVSKANVRDRLLTNYEAAETVGNAADLLYSDKVVLPLLTGASNSSPSTRTPERPASPRRTSATTNGSTPRKPSKRSSITTTPMVVTGPMAASPGGDSSSSLS
jgi:hypothetical protein